MIIARTIEEARAAVSAARRDNKTIGFVPTMGALHDGHLSLIHEAKKRASFTAMSIFVNRIQFNDLRDFEKYPRDDARDLALAQDAGVDLVFIPAHETMYAAALTFVDTTTLDRTLCGATRPGHFKGVCTVVAKLFNIMQPDVAVFGQKDIQQVRIIEKMTEDLNFPLRIVVAPIIREKDGLAMSSRNIHLSPDQRIRALCISKSLHKAEKLIAEGKVSPKDLEAEVRREIGLGSPDSIDYVSIVDYATLQETSVLGEKTVLAVAAFFGTTRLIDNMIITKEGSYTCII
jgi:pantoate--beta-alanine ligase